MFSETEQTSAMMRDGMFFLFLPAVEQRPDILTEFYVNDLFPYIHANVHKFCLSIAIKISDSYFNNKAAMGCFSC